MAAKTNRGQQAPPPPTAENIGRAARRLGLEVQVRLASFLLVRRPGGEWRRVTHRRLLHRSPSSAPPTWRWFIARESTPWRAVGPFTTLDDVVGQLALMQDVSAPVPSRTPRKAVR